MSAVSDSATRASTVASADGTTIAYRSVGAGRGLIVVGGVLSGAANYLPLARRLAGAFEVHLMNRRGRPGSGPQRPGHSIEDECDDLLAVMHATGAAVVFGHSFGGLVALETARRQSGLTTVLVYEPGVPLRGQLHPGWLDGYERLLARGDRRGAFAWMVKHAGFAPRAIELMPLWCTKGVLRLALGSGQWAAVEPLLEANLGEQRIQFALEAASPERFSTITAHTVLMGGDQSPDFISRALLAELAAVIPDATVDILPGLRHPAPERQPDQIGAAILRHSCVGIH
jgi:pimeloyl-ACP methyl ester carboxylesterase